MDHIGGTRGIMCPSVTIEDQEQGGSHHGWVMGHDARTDHNMLVFVPTLCGNGKNCRLVSAQPVELYDLHQTPDKNDWRYTYGMDALTPVSLVFAKKTSTINADNDTAL